MNKNIRDMFAGILNSDGENFTAAFDKEMSDRISDKLATKHVDITKSILKPDSEENEE